MIVHFIIAMHFSLSLPDHLGHSLQQGTISRQSVTAEHISGSCSQEICTIGRAAVTAEHISGSCSQEICTIGRAAVTAEHTSGSCSEERYKLRGLKKVLGMGCGGTPIIQGDSY
jgi:hypothetical protein